MVPSVALRQLRPQKCYRSIPGLSWATVGTWPGITPKSPVTAGSSAKSICDVKEEVNPWLGKHHMQASCCALQASRNLGRWASLSVLTSEMLIYVHEYAGPTSACLSICSCGRKKFIFIFSGTGSPSLNSFFFMKSVGKCGGASVEDTCFLNLSVKALAPVSTAEPSPSARQGLAVEMPLSWAANGRSRLVPALSIALHSVPYAMHM